MAMCVIFRCLSKNFTSSLPWLSRTAQLPPSRLVSKACFKRTLYTAPRLSAALRYTDKHEWVRVEDGLGTVGISNFAQVMAKCGEVDEVVACMTTHPGFATVCLDPWVLQVAHASYRQEHGDFEAPINRRYRHAAYRNFVLWCWGYLGKRVRVRLPACVVMGIRMNFPEPSGDYTGFKWPPL